VQDRIRVLADSVGPVVEHDHLLDVVGTRLLGVVDDQRGVQAVVGLNPGVRVEEVPSRVRHGELIDDDRKKSPTPASTTLAREDPSVRSSSVIRHHRRLYAAALRIADRPQR
jgi:hypothetical protein